MHYLELVCSIDPRSGGVIAGITALARERARHGDQTTVVSLDAPDAFDSSTLPFAWHGCGPGRGRYAYAPAYAPWLRTHAHTFDVVIINGLWQYHAFGAWRVLRKLGIPYFVFPHGMLDPWFKRTYPLKHLKKWLYWPWADYRVLRDATAVCFTCEQERILARESFWLYRANEQVVGYGINEPPAATPDQIAAFYALVPAAANKRTVLFLSRIHEKKGCDLLLHAFAHAMGSDPTWHLVMAGPDQDGWTPRLQRLAQDLGIANRISWPGMISGDAKWGAFRSAEVFCLPSHQENFGVVVAEALACGRPVLISDQVNIHTEISKANAGMVDRATKAGIATLLQRWAACSHQERQVMQTHARDAYVRFFQVTGAHHRLAQIAHTSHQHTTP